MATTSPLWLLTGPPGSGKTERLLKLAYERLERGERVWWVGVLGQRSDFYRRATRTGATLGLEFLSLQQVYYRLLARALKLQPIITQPGRIAYVGEALLKLRNELPAPGEARLFTYAIAEAKRYGLTPQQLQRQTPKDDAETRRFVEVFRLYEQVKQPNWDYDDFRAQAHSLAKRGEARPEADLIIVDRFRELAPLEMRLLEQLARVCEVWLSLPTPPPGFDADETMPPQTRTTLERYRAANPVAEARWVMRSLKQDLAQDTDPLDLAVVLPSREVKAFVALADEYGVPLMDESPKALADTLAGRVLLDLLDLTDYPTASRLLTISELVPLANAALDRGIAGDEAIRILAESLGLGDIWHEWGKLLEVPSDEIRWAESLIDTVLPRAQTGLEDSGGLSFATFRDYALQRAQEAQRVAKGANFRRWWAALIQETSLPTRPLGGVAVLDDRLVSGRRFKKVYLMHAVEGAYSANEREDYFIPEEARKPLDRVFDAVGLPKRFLGRDPALYAELLTRGDTVVVTYPEGDQGGQLVPETELTGDDPLRLPEIAAGSRLELPTAVTYRAPREPLSMGSISISKLKRYDECAFRHWGETRLSGDYDPPWWRRLVGEMGEYGKLNPARLGALHKSYPDAAAWLSDYAATLTKLTYGVRLPDKGPGPYARIDAALRQQSEVVLYKFVEPDSIDDEKEAESYLGKRWTELWAAGHVLGGYGGRYGTVRIVVWPILGAPLDATGSGITYPWRRITYREDRAKAAYQRFTSGDTSPTPGFQCRECRVFDVCREGTR